MVKANLLFDAVLHEVFYKNYDAEVFVKTRGGGTEKHYYNLDDSGKLLIYAKTDPNYPKNPTLLGKERPFNKKTKKLSLMWTEGSSFVEPLCNSENFQGKVVRSMNDLEIVKWAWEFKELTNPLEKFKSNEGTIMIIMIALIVAQLIQAFLLFMITQHLEIEIF